MKPGELSTTPGFRSGSLTSRPLQAATPATRARANSDDRQQQDTDFTAISDTPSTVAQVRPTKAQNRSQLGPASQASNPWNVLVLVLTLLIFAASGLADYRTQVLSDAPMAYWRLGELSGAIAYDSSGNGHDATYFNGVTLGAQGLLAGDLGTAVAFDGTSGYVLSNSLFLSTTTGITFEVWFAVDRSSPGYHFLIRGGGRSAVTGYHWLFLDNTTALGNLCWEYANINAGAVVCIPFEPAVGQPYHVVVTHDYLAKQINFYINGNLYPYAMVTHTDDVIPMVGEFVELGSYYHENYWFAGSLGQVAIYNRVLSASRIQMHSQAGGSRTPADYYVAPAGSDQNDGSVAWPFTSIQHAANVVLPGATVHVAPGIYSEAVVTRISGIATARVRFVSDTKWGAQIRSSSSGPTSMWTNSGNYVDIKGFDITGDGGDGTAGIDNQGSNVRIIGNHVHDINVHGCGSHGGAGIDNSNFSAYDDEVISNIVHDIGDLDSPNPCQSIQGIYHSNLRGHIWNNIVYGVSGTGITTWHAADHGVIANNLSFRNSDIGILVGDGDLPGGVVADWFIVSNNISVENRHYGIIEYGQVGTHNQYVNNLVYRNGVNILLRNPDQGTLSVDPGFVNYQPDGGGDYHLRPDSPCVDTGTDQGAPPYDLDGVARPQGAAFDIGPYEYYVNVDPDFSVAVSPSSASVRAGKAATYNVTISPVSGALNATVTLACSNLPARSSCSFSPSTVSAGADPVASRLTISTTAPARSLNWPFRGPGPGYQLAVWAGLSMLLLFGVLVNRTRPRLERLGFYLPVVLEICLLVLLAACGGRVNSGAPSLHGGTPVGSYSITITGRSGTPTHSATANLTVQ